MRIDFPEIRKLLFRYVVIRGRLGDEVSEAACHNEESVNLAIEGELTSIRLIHDSVYRHLNAHPPRDCEFEAVEELTAFLKPYSRPDTDVMGDADECTTRVSHALHIMTLIDSLTSGKRTLKSRNTCESPRPAPVSAEKPRRMKAGRRRPKQRELDVLEALSHRALTKAGLANTINVSESTVARATDFLTLVGRIESHGGLGYIRPDRPPKTDV